MFVEAIVAVWHGYSADPEGSDGARHTKHELVATEVAASLRYAEATLTRATRPAGEDEDDVD